jgi:MFS family permease
VQLKINRVNPSLLAIVIEGIFSRFSFGVISFALPLYAHHLGLSLTAIGVLMSVNLSVSLALKPLSGWMADRVGLKQGFIAGVGLRIVVPLMLAFFSMPVLLYVAKSVHGISKSVRDPSVDALIAEHGGKKSIASAFAWYSTAKSVAGSLGKGAAGFLLTLTASNFSMVFAVAIVASLLSLFVVIRYVRGVSPEHRTEPAPQDTSEPLPSARSAAQDTPEPLPSVREEGIQTKGPGLLKTILPFTGLGFFVAGAGQMLHGLFPLLATEYAGMSEAETGTLYVVTTFVILGAGPLFGWLSDHVSRKLVLLTRGVANVFSSAIYLVAPNPVGLSTIKVLDDTGKAAFNPAWGAVMAQVSSVDRRSRARSMGYMSLGQDGGEIAGPILAGLLWSLWGVPAVMGVRIILAIAAELYSLVIVRPLLKKLESHQSVEQEEPHSINLKLTNPNSANRQNGSFRRYQTENALLRELVETQSSQLQVLQEELEAKRQDIQELHVLLQRSGSSSGVKIVASQSTAPTNE